MPDPRSSLPTGPPTFESDRHSGTESTSRPPQSPSGLPPRLDELAGKRVWRWILSLGFILLATSLSVLRLPQKSRGTLWAEDGGIFIQDAVRRSGISSLFTPYEGYLHLIPRIATKTIVRFFPVAEYANAATVLSCFFIALVAYLIFLAAKQFTPNVWIRLLWAASTFLIPPGPVEALGNFANLHWYLLWLTPWLIFRPTRTWVQSIIFFLVGLAISLTSIIAIVFIPLFLYRWKDKFMWPFRIGLAIGVVCQIYVTTTYPRSPASGYPLNFVSLVEGWVINSSSAIFYGVNNQIGQTVIKFGPFAIVLSALVFAAALVVIAVLGNRLERMLAAGFTLASLGVWTAIQVANPTPYFDYVVFTQENWAGFILSRYATAPSLFLMAVLPLLALTLARRSMPLMGFVLGLALMIQLVHFLPAVAARDDGPEWATGVDQAVAQCQAEPGLNAADVPIAPRGWIVRDRVTIPCNMLIAGR